MDKIGADADMYNKLFRRHRRLLWVQVKNVRSEWMGVKWGRLKDWRCGTACSSPYDWLGAKHPHLSRYQPPRFYKGSQAYR